MYELMILSLLARFPLHGYMIAKIINDMLGPATKVSNGTLYPLLTKLKQAKLIAIVDEESEQEQGDHRARTFTLTDEGRRRFHQLMMNTTSNQGDYARIFHYKAGHLYALKPKERLHLINHYINYCQALILYYKAEAEDFVHEHDPASPPAFVENVLDVMEHNAAQWQAELDWAVRLRARESKRIEHELSQNESLSRERDVTDA